jgi:hypothetical protein
MKTLLLSILIASSFLLRAEGCSGPGIRILSHSNTYGGNLPTMYLPVGANYTVYALGNMSCFYPLMRLRLFRNDQLLVDNDSLCCQSFALPLGAYEGTYKVEVTISEHGLPWPRTWTYTIVNNPVGISQLPDINKYISCFVDVNLEKLFVQSTEVEINNVELVNLEGKVIFDSQVRGAQVSVPIGELPKGIYIVKVMVLNQKLCIKKIMIQN